MANTVIQLKYSNVTSTPPLLNIAEPAYSNVSNKLWINDGSGVVAIGGKYYTGLLDAATANNTSNTLVRRDTDGSFSANTIYVDGYDIYQFANAAFSTANTAQVAGGQIAGSYANSAYLHANSAYDQANTATTDASVADQRAVTSGSYANSAFSSANTAQSYADSAYAQANTATTDAATADQKAVSAGSYANSAYTKANTAQTQADSAYNQANTATQYAESAGDYANSAYAHANTKLSTSGGTIEGDLAVTGNLTVSGNTIHLDVTTLNVADPIIYLAADNYTSDAVDIGFVGNYFDGTAQRHSGLIRKESSNTFYLFTNYDEEFDTNLLNIANPSLVQATLSANVSANSVIVRNVDVLDRANSAYNQANTGTQNATSAGSYANSAYTQANTATTDAATADQKAVSAGIYANSAFDVANTALQQGGVIAGGYANSAYTQANSAYNQANTATQYAESAGSYANSAYSTANTASVNATSAGSYANSAYAQANTASVDAISAGSYANSAYLHANSAFAHSNLTLGYAEAGYAQANSATVNASAASSYANSAYGQANTATVNASTADQKAVSAGSYANSAYTQANTGTVLAQASFDVANTKLNSSGGTISGDLSISGDLFVSGNTVSIDTSTVRTDDSLIKLAANNVADLLDIGFYGQYNDGTDKFSGLVRDASDGIFKLFTGETTDPTGNVVSYSAENRATIEANFTGGNVSGLFNAISVSDGGLGVKTLGINEIVYGDGTNPVKTVGSSTEGHVLMISASGAPTFQYLNGGSF